MLAEDWGGGWRRGGGQGEGLREGGRKGRDGGGGTNLIVVTDEGNPIERGAQVDG